ncbi:hypothetical protein [Streptomyces sp. AS02]
MSRQELGGCISCTGSLVGQIETATRSRPGSSPSGRMRRC